MPAWDCAHLPPGTCSPDWPSWEKLLREPLTPSFFIHRPHSLFFPCVPCGLKPWTATSALRMDLLNTHPRCASCRHLVGLEPATFGPTKESALVAAEPVPSDLPSKLLSKPGRLQRNADTTVGPSWLAANQEGIALFCFVFLGAACSTQVLYRRKGCRV